MDVGFISNTYSGITGGNGALNSARTNAENAKFSELVERLQAQDDGRGTLSSAQIAEEGRLNGDYTTGYSGAFSLESDKTAIATGAAANQANPHVQAQTIDKTSKLYESALELEGFFVKQMLSQMRKTIMKSNDNSFAQDMYEDMLFDEYATAMTKNAGFGLADQIYLSLMA